MDDVERLKDDVLSGRIDAQRLVDLVVTLQRRLQEAQRRIEVLETKLGGAAAARITEPFSLRAEEPRQEARGKQRPRRKSPARRGRLRTADKVALAGRTEQVYPAGVAQSDCQRSHTRPCLASPGTGKSSRLG
jgi:hypothetical protein